MRFRQSSLFGDSESLPLPVTLGSSTRLSLVREENSELSVELVEKVTSTDSQTNHPPAKWGYCRICGSPIAIPGNDADLCSAPARTCGSSGWVNNPVWGLILSSQRRGEKA
jgi:hypothetical protein